MRAQIISVSIVGVCSGFIWRKHLMNKKLPSRELLIFDEAHLLETEVVKFRGVAISIHLWVDGQLNTAIRERSRILELQDRLKEWLQELR